MTRQLTSSYHRVVTHYTVQVKQSIVTQTRRPGFRPFFTYGMMGAVAHWRSYPQAAHVRTEFSFPGAAAIGAGVEHDVGSHVAVRANGQLLTFLWIPLGARFTGSASISLGRHDRP